MQRQDDLTDQLMQMLRTVYEERSSDSEVDPAVLASDVIFQLDPDRKSPLLVQWGCVLELRQLGRSICREQTTSSKAAKQQTLFGDLQPRYPAMRNKRDVYVLREDLTFEERKRVIESLRNEAKAKWDHADALEAETEFLASNGWFDRAEANIT